MIKCLKKIFCNHRDKMSTHISYSFGDKIIEEKCDFCNFIREKIITKCEHSKTIEIPDLSSGWDTSEDSYTLWRKHCKYCDKFIDARLENLSEKWRKEAEIEAEEKAKAFWKTL